MAKILIVDDEYANRYLVATLARHNGHEAVEAGDAADALEAASRERPDLILVDLSLPGTSGTELIRSLRANDGIAGCAIALYTATQISPAIRDFMDAYAVDAAIPKPCEPEALWSQIEAALRARP